MSLFPKSFLPCLGPLKLEKTFNLKDTQVLTGKFCSSNGKFRRDEMGHSVKSLSQGNVSCYGNCRILGG